MKRILGATADPGVKILDIDRDNKQVVHGINRVLRRLDL